MGWNLTSWGGVNGSFREKMDGDLARTTRCYLGWPWGSPPTLLIAQSLRPHVGLSVRYRPFYLPPPNIKMGSKEEPLHVIVVGAGEHTILIRLKHARKMTI